MFSTAQAGGKLQLMLRNITLLHDGQLIVAPILPDSMQVAKWEAKGKTEKVTDYLEKIKEANAHLRRYFGEEYQFSRWRFVPDSVKMDTWADYRAYFSQFPKDSVFVLQFGYAAQYAKPTYKKIRKYDRDFYGIYEPDCKSRVYLNAGKATLFHQSHYVISILENLNASLKRYYDKSHKGKTSHLKS